MEIGSVAESYFNTLFKSTRHLSEEYSSVFNGFQARVIDSMNIDLTKSVTIDEIQAAVFNIGADRTPGPDVFTGAFYHQFWSEINSSIYEEVHSFFTMGHIQGATNHTNFCLIPKIDAPQTMSDFRPIALCNVCYKIISKILVGRLKKAFIIYHL